MLKEVMLRISIQLTLILNFPVLVIHGSQSHAGEVNGDLDLSSAFCPSQPITGEAHGHAHYNVSLQYIKQIAAAAAWSEFCLVILKGAVEGSEMHLGHGCINCSDAANSCCIQYAPWAYYCHQIFTEAKSRITIFILERFAR